MITEQFYNWQLQEILDQRFLPYDSCNQQWVVNHKFDTLPDGRAMTDIPGFPAAKDAFTFAFSDLNEDGVLDGLVTFSPSQCDGGNSLMWLQWQVLFLSNNKRYELRENIPLSSFEGTEFDTKGFYWIDSLVGNHIFGTYLEFKDNDAQCCPSIKNRVKFDFNRKRLVWKGRK